MILCVVCKAIFPRLPDVCRLGRRSETRRGPSAYPPIPRNNILAVKMKKFFRSGAAIAAAANVIIVAMLVSLGVFAFVGAEDPDTVSAFDDPVYNTDADGKVSVMINVYQGSDYVMQLLDIFEDRGAKCTFFIGGCWADDNNDVINAIVDGGHEIGNHGYFHKDHKTLDREGNVSEITSLNSLMEAMTGTAPTLFAPPSGSWNELTLEVCRDLGMRVIMWSRDTIDWRDQNAQVIYTRATKDLKSGELILAHPTEKTVEAMPEILTYIEKAGLHAVTVSELLAS